MKKTAVEWVFQELDNFYQMKSNFKSKEEILKIGEEMEKEEIINAHLDGQEIMSQFATTGKQNHTATDYYNKIKNNLAE